MHNLTTNLHIYTLKSAKSATPTLIQPLTPYHSPCYDLHKYTESKNLLNNTKLNHEQKFSPPVPPIYENLNSLQSFRPPSHLWNKSATLYNKTLLVFKVFVCGGGDSVLIKATWHATPHNNRTAHHQARRNTTKVVIIAYSDYIAARRKDTPQISLHYTLLYKVRIQAYINSVIITI